MTSCNAARFCTRAKTYEVVMVRHGESEWNKLNLFTGWYDTSLSEKGKEEAIAAGKALKERNFRFDIAFTSVLKRAICTLDYILKELRQTDLSIVRSWRLNERHYGALTGLNKEETAQKYGGKQVLVWRRSFSTPPPPMERNHPFYDNIVNDSIYDEDGPSKGEFPMAESLELTIKRTMPFWEECIVPTIKADKRVLVAAHGNSLRGIVKTLDELAPEEIMELNLPTGIPFVYSLDGDMKPVPGGSLKFIGDAELVKKAMEKVKDQTKSSKK